MRTIYWLLLLGCLLPLRGWAQGPQGVNGTVQTEAGVPLPGATVFFKGTYTGSSSNEEGQFQLKGDFSKGTLTLVVSFIGYETQELLLAAPDNALVVTLRPSAMLDQVVVAASRVEESIGQVPVTIEKLDQRQVEQITTPDLVAGLGRFKGIDISSSSMLISSFSTRGFNSSRSERIIQLADYMDTQIPSLSSNFGNLLGMPVLDVASVEVVHGPASALYGANAFNGVLLTNSKDAFRDRGLIIRLRGGNRDMRDGQFRFATKLGEHAAFKISGGAIQADDFRVDNQDATASVIESANNAAGSNLGYDAVSRYGDSNTNYTFGTYVINPATRQPYTTPQGQPLRTPAELVGKTLFLPGFSENDLIAGDNKTHSYKIAPSLAVLLSSRVKATIDYRYTNGTSTYQSASRYRFINSGAHQERLQLEGNNWFVRAFSTQDFSGKRDPQVDGSYNLGFLGGFLQNQLVPNSTSVTYGQRYVGTYLGNLAGQLNAGQSADAATRAAYAAALPTQIQPGSPDFIAARNQIIHNSTQGQGARLVLRSILSEASGQYTFHNDFADLTVGAAYRQFLLGSDGSLFQDTKDGDRIRNYEYGAYAQATKTLLDEHLKLAVAGRVDKFQNFGTAFSPRASAVYSLGADKLHNLRLSYSRAFRAPTQNDQYIRLDVGRAILLGNIDKGFNGYSLNVLKGGSPADANNIYHADKLRLEQVNSVEVGYRAQVAKKLYIDVDYFYNAYNDFIATQNFVGRTDNQFVGPSPADIATTNAPGSNVRVIQIAANVDQRVQSQGAGLTLNYSFSPMLTVNTNYSYNALITTDFKVGTQSFFNTPKHKFNLGFDGQALDRKLSYNVNYRWVDTYRYESTFATGDIPVAQTVDAQMGYLIKPAHLTLQAGVTNLFDATNYQVYGAPSYGRLGYFGLLFDLK